MIVLNRISVVSSSGRTPFDARGPLDARHEALPNKSQPYAVEADNAELRHYLARLGRRSRCFTRSLQALRDALKLFVYAWNRRQLHRRAHPKYPAHVFEFLYPTS